ncbi:MAG: hypothetical protein LUD74_04215, partial [Tannerellaceae bacterium]|nr:hypothetical protein [Tannerellaceae bacterium]
IYTFPTIETPGGWVSAAITLSPLNKLVTLEYEGKQKHLPYSFEKRTFLRMAFGYCPFEGYESTGVAGVTLRDIRLQQNGIPFRYWQLEAHADTLCYDSVIYMPARVTNPYWIVNKGSNDTPEAYRQAGPDDPNGYGVIWKMLLCVGAVFVLTAAVMQFLYMKNRRRSSNE